MRIIKSFFIAVSMYSKIPVPQFAWEEKDMQYIFCFFPWIGALIGVCIYGWNALCESRGIDTLCRVAVAAAIPLFITGGLHVDGFMDTMDAIHSYQTKERRLEILKDSHIGAFAVIMLAVYGLVFLGAFSEIAETETLKVICCGFVLSRCLCGISALSFPLAKKEGTLSLFADCSQKNIVKAFLYLQSIVCIGGMLYWSLSTGLLVAGAALFSLLYYYYRSKKEFGGVTGDTAGYFVLLCEGWMAVAAVLAQYLTI